ncbi:Arc family DNA-binding protein [Draconibacterium sp.]|uniref:Arc family DNA-binding protein n=1 Tax=Draconibacterium sp. TaxID=1965318 RepID=UPI0029C7BEAE|nr:Arc family DNA-binding protein [uncultured Draconibacterium sp.]
MAKKKSFVLRVSPEMLEAVEKWAADDFRSMNGQIEWIIHKALKDARRLKKGLDDGKV